MKTPETDRNNSCRFLFLDHLKKLCIFLSNIYPLKWIVIQMIQSLRYFLSIASSFMPTIFSLYPRMLLPAPSSSASFLT